MKETAIKLATAVFVAALATPQVHAQSQSYVSASGGWTIRTDSTNAGELTADFMTGAGTTIPAGTPLPAGASLGWTTMFDTGYNAGASYGMRSDWGFRAEVEVRYLRNSITGHEKVNVAGIGMDPEDAGVLISGSPNLGVTVAQVVADGRGHSDSWTFMANAYYDFNADGRVNPYLGGGAGYATTAVEFMPSGVDVSSDRAHTFAYQGIAGVDVPVGDAARFFTEYRYFGTPDARIDLSLIPGYLDVEQGSHLINFGIRFHF